MMSNKANLMNIVFPTTTSTVYRDISFLLSILAQGITEDTPFYVLALSAFGLSYSVNPQDIEKILDYLKQRILSVEPQSDITARNAESLGFAAHVLMKHNEWNRILQNKEKEILIYFEKIAEAQWLRSSSVATTFLMGFSDLSAFRLLVSKAESYLREQLQKTPGKANPINLYGLTLTDHVPTINDTIVTNWLRRTHQPFMDLCMLAIALDTLNHHLSSEAITRLQKAVSKTYLQIIEPNINIIQAVLAVIHLAEMGEPANEIMDRLNSLPGYENSQTSLNAVIRADSLLFVEFRDGLLAKPPAIEFLAYYLFAASETGLSKAYIINETLKRQFAEFIITCQNVGFTAVDRASLGFLILLSLGTGFFTVFRIWWPLSSRLYDYITAEFTHPLISSYLDDILKGLIILPIYSLLGSLLALWLNGQVEWNDIGLASILQNVIAVFKQFFFRSED